MTVLILIVEGNRCNNDSDQYAGELERGLRIKRDNLLTDQALSWLEQY